VSIALKGEDMTTAQPQVLNAFCRACGGSIDSRAELCPKCGVRQKSGATGQSRITAALLAFFLGGLGAHKFYLGKPALGVVYLIFCWTFIPAVFALIEGIGFLSMSDEDFAEKHGTPSR
jgi:TM2 domain-containing membrane protein YozV